MRPYVNAIRQSLRTENWYSALFVALSLPDICGSLERPQEYSKVRYVDWYRRYLSPAYAASPDHPFLSPEDCYALRCAMLHEGASDLTAQRSRDILDEVCFVSPVSGGLGGFVRVGHCFRLTNVAINEREFSSAVCLHVTAFCEDVCKGVEKWLCDVAGDADVQCRLNGLLTIY
ncbi:MAG: hypothetical protein HYU66_28780 [Armatimonadetes bacterium]|nr:hypothetical protein [Armatimonadota bacterium]